MNKIFKIPILCVLWVICKVFGLFGNKKSIAVLAYHSISNNDWRFSVSPKDFEKQIRLLIDKKYRFIDFDELLRFLNNETELSSKSVVLTFDDGYEDFIENALPILNQYNIPAIVAIHSNRSNKELNNNFKLMSWEQVKSLPSSIKIANHSLSHTNLKELNEKQLFEQIIDSTRVFEERLGTRPNIFCYPGGKYSSKIIDLIRSQGYEMAFTINEGLVSKNQSGFELKRITIENKTSLFEFSLKLSCAVDLYNKIKNG